jgi:hypothetical protein
MENGATGRVMATANMSGRLGVVLGALGLTAGLVGAGLALAASASSSAPADTARRSASDFVVTSTAMPDGDVAVTILDVAQQRLAFYVADAKRTRLKLLAVRDISADMSLTDWNNDPPLPKDVRAMVEKRADAVRPAPVPDPKVPAGL